MAHHEPFELRAIPRMKLAANPSPRNLKPIRTDSSDAISEIISVYRGSVSGSSADPFIDQCSSIYSRDSGNYGRTSVSSLLCLEHSVES